MNREFAAQFQREGDLARVNDLIAKKYPVNRFDDLGKTPLHHAVEAGHLNVVDRLIKAGANVNVNAYDEPGSGAGSG